jgi:hypothetical protein
VGEPAESEIERERVAEESGGVELVVLVDGGEDVPRAAEPLGEDDEVAGAELHALGRALDVRPHLALEKVARLPRVELHRELPRRAAPPAREEMSTCTAAISPTNREMKEPSRGKTKHGSERSALLYSLGPGLDAELLQAGLRRVALDDDGEAAGRVGAHAVRVRARGRHGRVSAGGDRRRMLVVAWSWGSGAGSGVRASPARALKFRILQHGPSPAGALRLSAPHGL